MHSDINPDIAEACCRYRLNWQARAAQASLRTMNERPWAGSFFIEKNPLRLGLVDLNRTYFPLGDAEVGILFRRVHDLGIFDA
jgi:hypothetical protein